MKLHYHAPIDNTHQFRINSIDNETIALRVTHEGIIIEIEDEDGEVIRTAYQFWSDLDEITQPRLCNCKVCTQQRWDNHQLIKAQNQAKET